MSEKKMLIVPAKLVGKINENRGDMSQAEFIDFLIDSHLGQNSKEGYVTQETIQEFEQGIKDLLRSFLEFFVSYGLELGSQPAKGKFEELSGKLQRRGRTFMAESPEE